LWLVADQAATRLDRDGVGLSGKNAMDEEAMAGELVSE